MRKLKTWQIITVGEIAFIAVLFLLSPWLKSTMAMDTKDESQRAQEIQKRLQKKQAAEKAKRQKSKIASKDLEKLKKDKIDKAKRDMKRKVKKLAKLHEDMKKERIKREKMIKNRSKKDVMAHKAKKMEDMIKKMEHQAKVLKNDKNGKKQQDIQDKVQDIKELSEEIAKGDEEALAQSLKEMEDLKEQLKDLRAEQEQALHHPEPNQEPVGAPGHTAWMQELLSPLEATAEDLAATSQQQANDLSSLSPMEQLPSKAMDDMSLQELYDQAQQMEKAIGQDFQASKKMEVAMKEGMSLSEVAPSMMGTTPDRPQQDFQGMGQQVKTAQDMNQFGQKLQGAAAQVGAMAKSASTMMKQISGSPSSLSAAMQQAKLQQQMQAAVRGGPQAGKNTMNLAAMMRQASAQSQSSLGMSSGSPSSQKNGQGKGKGGSMGSEGGGKGGGMGQGGGEGGAQSDRNRGGGGKAMASSSKVKQNLLRMDSKRIQAEALPGRRFTQKSSRSGWLYVDTWYVIGPWENKGRIDYETIHPPEFEVDLSKSYLDGKKTADGQPRELKWAFTQGSNMKIVPPEEQGNSTYYAWTEVYFEEDRDMLLAIASDDAAKVWINDMLVWEDHGQSAWNLDEGFRVVYFKKGFNKVLVRIENGPILCTFSLLLCPPQS